MPTKYTRDDFHGRALGLRHALKQETQSQPSARKSPRQLRIVILLSALGIAVLYIGGEFFAQTKFARQRTYDAGLATIIDLRPIESGQDEPDYLVELEIEQEDAPNLETTMRIGRQGARYMKAGDQVGVEYRVVDGAVDVRKLEVIVEKDAAPSPSATEKQGERSAE